MSTARPLSGVFPIAPTPFTADGELDLDGQRRVLDCMIDQGVDGICILANYSEQFLLSDDERDTLLDLCLTQVRGRAGHRDLQSLQHSDRGSGRKPRRRRARRC
jgi:dihydrodipicolinate synthase/N-acetylneuraminate lyase